MRVKLHERCRIKRKFVSAKSNSSSLLDNDQLCCHHVRYFFSITSRYVPVIVAKDQSEDSANSAF